MDSNHHTNHLRIVIWGIIAITLVACGEIRTDRRTLEAQLNFHETRRAALYTTATVAIERELIVVEDAQTQVARAKAQQAGMLSTLEARGVDISILPLAATLPSYPTQPTVPPQFGEPTALPVTQPVAAPQVTPFTMTPANTVVPQIATTNSLRSIAMARGVDDNDCATGITDIFNTETERIYIVVQAIDIQSGMVITSRWLRDDIELVTFNFTPDFHIEDACVWFFADQTDFDFMPGNYSIILEVNSIPASQPIPFTIVDAGG